MNYREEPAQFWGALFAVQIFFITFIWCIHHIETTPNWEGATIAGVTIIGMAFGVLSKIAYLHWRD